MPNAFIYNRTITITRPAAHTTVGPVGYGGVTQATETAVLSGLKASIQAKSGSTRPRAGDLPASPPAPIGWNIYLPRNAVANGVIKDRDIVTDDNGDRYQVDAANWTPMGYKLMTIRLEAH